jgi:hypothetical protein
VFPWRGSKPGSFAGGKSLFFWEVQTGLFARGGSISLGAIQTGSFAERTSISLGDPLNRPFLTHLPCHSLDFVKNNFVFKKEHFSGEGPNRAHPLEGRAFLWGEHLASVFWRTSLSLSTSLKID